MTPPEDFATVYRAYIAAKPQLNFRQRNAYIARLVDLALGIDTPEEVERQALETFHCGLAQMRRPLRAPRRKLTHGSHGAQRVSPAAIVAELLDEGFVDADWLASVTGASQMTIRVLKTRRRQGQSKRLLEKAPAR